MSTNKKFAAQFPGVIMFDFTASLNHTHHLQSILGFCNFFKKQHLKNLSILLPIGSSLKSELRLLGFDAHSTLIPLSHQSKTSLGDPLTIVNRLVAWLLRIFTRTHQNRLSRACYNAITILMTFFSLPLLFLRRHRSSIVFFPTACPQAFLTVRILETLRIRRLTHLRFTNTSEVRAPHSNQAKVHRFMSMAKDFRFVKVVFSFETLELASFYQKFAERPWVSPLPQSLAHLSEERKSVGYNLTPQIPITISFLGRPHDQSRLQSLFETLDGLVDEICKRGVKVSSINCSANDEYDVEKISLLANFKISRISYPLAFYDLVRVIRSSTLVVLNYNPEILVRNHSSLAILCHDLRTPILTHDKLPCSRDLQLYGLGLTFNDSSSLRKAILNFLSGKVNIEKKFQEYDEYRNTANSTILSEILKEYGLLYK